MRNMLLKNGVKLRNKKEAAGVMINRHPEWKDKFLKYTVSKESRQLSDSKIKLLFFLFTEGCIHNQKVQFTNNDQSLRDSFSVLMKGVYGVQTKTTCGIVSYISSREIAKDLVAYDIKNSIPDEIIGKLLLSKKLTRDVLRIFADTEGSVTISVRKITKNYTVADRRVTIACMNEKVKPQFVMLLKSLGIIGYAGKLGVVIMDETSIREFDKQVGFSSEVRVIRKKANYGLWYHYKKSLLLKLVIRIYDEQKMRNQAKHMGVFAQCTTKSEVLTILNSWYNELRGD